VCHFAQEKRLDNCVGQRTDVQATFRHRGTRPARRQPRRHFNFLSSPTRAKARMTHASAQYHHRWTVLWRNGVLGIFGQAYEAPMSGQLRFRSVAIHTAPVCGSKLTCTSTASSIAFFGSRPSIFGIGKREKNSCDRYEDLKLRSRTGKTTAGLQTPTQSVGQHNNIITTL